MKTNNPCIYRIRNITNDDAYYGSAINSFKRMQAHKFNLINNKHINRFLQNAWNKYGEDSFVFEIIELVSDTSVLIEREQFYIDNFQHRYNIRQVAKSNLGVKYTDESKLKMGLWVRTDDYKKKISIANTGKHHSEETLVKLRDAKLGKKASDETKLKMSLKRLGKPLSEEHKQNLRKPKSDEHKKNISKARTGIKFSDETKLKMSIISKEKYPNGFWHKPHTDETKRKLSEKAKARGTKPPNRRPFMIGAVRYESLYEARDKLNITLAALQYRLKNKKFNDYQYIKNER